MSGLRSTMFAIFKFRNVSFEMIGFARNRNKVSKVEVGNGFKR